MSRLRLGLIGFIALLFTFFPLASQAFDARCFTLSQCTTQNGFAKDEGNIQDFFYSKLDARIACGVNKNIKTINGMEVGVNAAQEPVGFCLAAGQAVNKIAIGGRRTFSDLGQFIKYGYEYGMWIAGILATTMIVIAGFQWLTSGGNSDAIGSAKKKIAGAITGLLLLSLSYVILNTINPYLTELRLPKTWMINTVQMAAPFCSEVENANLAYLGPDGVTISDEEKNKKFSEAESNNYPITPTSTVVLGADGSPDQTASPVCGHRYLVDGTGGQSCVGDLCGGGLTCVPFTTPSTIDVDQMVTNALQSDIKRKSDCWNGQLIIDYKVDSLLDGVINQVSKNWVGQLDADNNGNDWIQDSAGSGQDTDIWVYPVCQIVNPPASVADNYNNTPSSEDRAKILNTLGSNPFVNDNGQYVTPVSKILAIQRPNTFKEYLIRYGFGKEDFDTLYNSCVINSKDTVASGKPIYAKLLGVVVKNQININWGGFSLDPLKWGADALVYTYKDEQGKGSAGLWIRRTMDLNNGGDFSDIDYFFPKGYIPIKDIDGSTKKGLYLDFTLPPDTLQNIGAAITDTFGD